MLPPAPPQSLLLRLLAVVLLVAANAFFVAAEFALVAARRTRIEALARRGDAKAKTVQKALHDLYRQLSAAQLGITLASILLGYVAEDAVAHLFRDWFASLPPALDFLARGGVASTVALAVITFLHVVFGEQAPKAWKDVLSPAFRDGISAKLATSGMQHAQWYVLRKLYGNDFWQEFAKQRPKGFDSRAQLFDRLAKGDDRMCALAEYAGYTLFKDKGADIEFVAPPDGLPATPIFLGVVNKAPHPEAARLFVDWALSKRGQAIYQNEKILLYGSLRNDAGPMPTGKRLGDFKLLFPSDWTDFQTSHAVFVKEWNGIMGL